MPRIVVNEFDIAFDLGSGTGYFEWVGGTNEDEECAGSLHIDGATLVDYDGVYELPEAVKTGLIELGIDLGDCA